MRRELDGGIVPSSAKRTTPHEPLLERQEEEKASSLLRRAGALDRRTCTDAAETKKKKNGGEGGMVALVRPPLLTATLLTGRQDSSRNWDFLHEGGLTVRAITVRAGNSDATTRRFRKGRGRREERGSLTAGPHISATLPTKEVPASSTHAARTHSGSLLVLLAHSAALRASFDSVLQGDFSLLSWAQRGSRGRQGWARARARRHCVCE